LLRSAARLRTASGRRRLPARRHSLAALITAAADELLTHLLSAGKDVLAGEEGVFMTLARIGAWAIMTRVEVGEGTEAKHGTSMQAPAG
jgi:hypothetical protein